MDDSAHTPPSPEALEQLLLGEAVSRLSREVSDIRKDLDGRIEFNARQLRFMRQSVDRMRLDRQVRRLPNATRQAMRRALGRRAPEGAVGERHATPLIPWQHSSASTLLIVAHAYPLDLRSYGGQPLARRLPHYIDAGHHVVVFIPTKGEATDQIAPDGVRVVVSDLNHLNEVARQIGATQLLIHSPTPEIWAHAKPLSALMPTHTWMHGFESRSWRELGFDFTAQEVEERSPRMDAYDTEKRKVLAEILSAPEITSIFVSSFLQQVAEQFAGCAASNAHVIHNIIDLEAFPYRARTAADRFRVTSVRSFNKRNYGTDLLTLAIRELRSQPWFDELAIRIIGDGRYFDEDTSELSNLPNVSLERHFVGPNDLSRVLSQSGIALLPTRWDSQGMMMGESMASGLVPVTNGVAAIPEFVDAESGILAGDGDYKGLADGIAALVDDPNRYLELSRGAFARVKAQCHVGVTVAAELELIANAKQDANVRS
jgi:glycosyltransferase involved in cell wall biosynthesis